MVLIILGYNFSNGYYPMFENGTYLYDELFGTMEVSSGGSLSITDNNIFAKGTLGAFFSRYD